MEKIQIIQKTYKEYVLEHGTPPPSVFIFMKRLNLTEGEFYDFYNNFESIEQDDWLTSFQQARDLAESEEVYFQYSVREKLLSFYYTWVEVLKKDRSYFVYSYQRLKQPVGRHTGHLALLKDAFSAFALELVMEGRESKEVVIRPVISDKYVDGLWMQCLYILDFWVKDTSRGFEKTDTAIEKMVNTSFDLMGQSVVDTVLDLAKFVYQNR
ncbi:TetR family transcriptional regulator C-terminal domain-containing protein [Telluribacter sp.]|jgi:hypothetical protein|uniref:TetR family transcriptional regulator C-terminal domain-containing protein n=1 Tax=Telluribacter sp. TaxID=1978767 RepID=UPI002E0F03BC|nr:TetR family transcriptional regulator C-terminal domain-containing protein [Telluribacter sp.]